MMPQNKSVRLPRGNLRFILLFCFCISLTIFLLQPEFAFNKTNITQDQTKQDIQILEPGKPIERQLAGGESHIYKIKLDAGQYFYMVVEQKGIDVVVSVTGPDSQKIVQVDSPNGMQGPEPVKFVTEFAGVYLTNISSLEKEATAGSYEIKIEELRTAKAQDRDFILVERTEAEAKQFFRQGTVESLQQAKEKYAEALLLWQKVGNQKQQVYSLIAMGVISNYQDEHQQAIEYYQQALPLAQANRDSLSISSILSNIGATYYKKFDNQKAIEYYDRALPIAIALGRSEDQVNMLNMIGMTYSRMGNNQSAIDYFEKAYLLSQKVQYKWGEAYSCSNLGSYYFGQSDLSNAVECFKKAKEIHQQIGAKRGEANDLHNLGFIYDIWQEKQQALEYFSQANRLFKLVGDRDGEANNINSMGWIYFDLGERQLALDMFQQALNIWHKIDDRQGQSIAQNGIGRAYLENGEYDQAINYFQQSLDIANELKDQKYQAISLNNIGLVFIHQGKWEEAIKYFQDALNYRKNVGDPVGECYSENCLGKAYLKLNDFTRALDHFNQALLISQKIGDRRMQVASFYNLAHVESRLGNLNKSKQHIEMSINMIEQLRTKINSRDLQVSFSGVINDYYKFYIELLMQMHNNQPSARYDIEALNVSERARARSMLDNLAESLSEIHQGIDSQLLEKEKTLRRELNALEQNRLQLLKDKKSPDEIAGVEKQLRAVLARYDELFSQIRQQYPGYADLMRPVPLDVKEIQQQVVDNNTTLLEFLLGEKRSFLWMVTPADVASYELPAGQQIDSVAIRVYNLLTVRNQRLEKETSNEKVQRIASADRELNIALLELSKMILNPVAKKLTGSRLLIIGEGALQYIPFTILPLPDSSAIASTGMDRSLLANYEIICLPSASVLPIIRQQVSKRNRAELGLAVLADPVFSADDPRVKSVKLIAEKETKMDEMDNEMSEFAQQTFLRSFEETGSGTDRSGITRLPFSRMEANAILDLVPKEMRLEAFDFKASYETATNAMLQQYQIIHFATHGLLNSQHPQLSGIVLSLVDEQGHPINGFMRLFDIYNLNISADLVVLSACQTALGKDIKGEGLIGLTRGFMYAGAPRVVATLWKVDDEATAELMKLFYQYMLGEEKLPAAAALRQAQISIMNEKRWQSPYYWAGFILQGDWK